MSRSRVGILTISDRGAGGIYADTSGPLLKEIIINNLEATVEQTSLIPDDLETIKQVLTEWVDMLHLDLILTTGGTGFAPRDVTPEATKQVIQREAPGLVLAMLNGSLAITPHAMLSRMAAGIRAQSLIINLPGSPKAARENLQTILPALPHALQLLKNDPTAPTSH